MVNYEMGYSPASGFEGIHEPSLLDFHGCLSEAGMVRCYPVSSMAFNYLPLESKDFEISLLFCDFYWTMFYIKYMLKLIYTFYVI